MNLFTTYYATDPQRQQELAESLASNIQNTLIESIHVFLDPNTSESILEQFKQQPGFDKVSYLRSVGKPSYREWLDHSRTRLGRGISIFANADISFDETLAKLGDYVALPRSIVCLTRHEDVRGTPKLHKTPRWSQDVWAMRSENIADITFLEQLSFETGQPRCDNRCAFVFAIHGWNIFNPCVDVRAIHKHQYNTRSYSKGSPVNIGGMGMVWPSHSPRSPSKVDIEVFCLDSQNITGCRLNKFLEPQ